MKIKCKLYHDNFQNFKRYNIPKAQLIMEEYFCSWSGGVDSTATAILALEHKEPLTALVYCEVMFDKEVSGEVPEHAEFVHGTAIPWFQRHGAPVVHLKSEKTFMDIFWHQIKKGKRAGKYQGFPSPGFCKIQDRCKTPPLDQFRRAHKGATQYIGYAADEDKRLLRLGGNKVSLLQKYGVTHDEAREICKRAGLLSPIYEFCKRGGCFFCPNASDNEFRHLRTHHRELWDKLLELQNVENVAFPGRFRLDDNIIYMESRFDLEEQQITWEDLEL